MSSSSKPPDSELPWSGEVRSLVSLLLFLHLFVLFVAVTTYTRPSGLQERLHQLFAPYLRTLHLTAFPVTYPFARYHLTHALPTDVDFTCEVEFVGTDGKPETVLIPSGPLWPPIRSRRYQALANATGALSDEEADEDLAGILPRALAASVLARHGVSQGTFRVRAHYLPQIEQMAEVETGKRPAINETVTYEAQVIVSGGTVELLKKSRTLEVAPVRPGEPGGKNASGKSSP